MPLTGIVYIVYEGKMKSILYKKSIPSLHYTKGIQYNDNNNKTIMIERLNNYNKINTSEIIKLMIMIMSIPVITAY